MKRLLAFLTLASCALAGTWMASPGKGSHASGVVAPTPDILWWKFTNGSGTTVTATVGPNGSTDATWLTGKSGSGFALGFNGTTQDASSVSAITYGTNVITVTGWVYLNNNSNTQVIWESSPNINSAADAFVCFVDAGVLYGSERGSTGFRSENITAPATGAWFHLAIVYDASTVQGNVKIYLNGVDQSTSIGLDLKDGTTNFDVQTLYSGARGTSSLFLNGRIDDLRISTTELTSGQINAIMNDPQ